MPSLSKDAKQMLGCGLDVVSDKWPRLFMGMVHHRTTKGERMTFRDKPWLTVIYKDNSHDMVIIKCSQVHMTEHALCAMFTYANKGKRGMYVLPSKEHRKTFVADRINTMKDYSSLYANAIKLMSAESDSNVYKNIFGKGWKFVGSNVKKDFFEFPCEVLMFDEFDELDQDNLWYAYDRVANAKNPVIWKFGNPTRENFGIHAEFMASDQKEWHVDCEHCGHEQVLDWYTHFVTPHHGTWRLRHPAGRPICTECDKDFDRTGPGRWIAMNPGSGRPSGYRITRLFIKKGKNHNKNMVQMFKRFIKSQNNPTALQNFHNNYLGTTYENIDFKISDPVLARSVYEGEKVEFDPHIFRTMMGVDQGKNFTCVISMVWDGELIDLAYRNVKHWTDVQQLEADWNVHYTVIDANGGGYEETRKFVNEKKGSRWMCYYRPKDQIKGKKYYKKEHKDCSVAVNRTEVIDLVVKSLIDKKTHVRPDWKHVVNGEFRSQMLDPSRITNAAGMPVWTKGKDHFLHACAYRYLAYSISGMSHSISKDTSWHTGKAAEDGVINPEPHIIGEIANQTEKPKVKRKWHV